MKIAIVLGTRPEIIKMSPIIRLAEQKKLNYFVIHTNQHYSANMDQVFFKDLELPQPQYNLKIQSSLHGEMTGKMLVEIEKILLKEKPDWALVEGDTNTVLAGALAASKLGIKVGHVEAGLRSYDRTMPEELNRIMTDHVSDLLFAPTQVQEEILLGEAIGKEKIKVTGNTVVDAVIQNMKIAQQKIKRNQYDFDYFLLTMHRPANVDQEIKLKQAISSLEYLADQLNTRIIFPIHPRTEKNLKKFNVKVNSNKIEVIEPVGYLEMLILQKNAKLILTDSGGIQEEACVLQVPCVTLRDNTERPETLEVGANILTSLSKASLLKSVKEMLKRDKFWKNPFGKGDSASKILKEL